MAFDGVEFFSPVPGAQTRTTWIFPAGDGDRGARYFSARPLIPVAETVSFAAAKVPGSDDTFRNRFTARNMGGFPVNFYEEGKSR